MAQIQNPGWRAGVSRDMLGGSSRFPSISSGFREQWLCSRFGLNLPLARLVSLHHFGEAGDEH